MNKIKLVKLDFEDILKHDSEILCVHTFLKDPKYSKPMLFNELLVEIGTDFGPGNCKSIFRDGEWYIKTSDSNKTLATIIDMSKYRDRVNNNYIKKELNNIYFDISENDNEVYSLFDSILDDIYSDKNLINNLFTHIEEIDNELFGKNNININPFEEIEKIVTLKKPRVDIIASDELDRLLDDYIDNIGEVVDKNNQYLGELISYNKNKITIKMNNLDLYNSMKEHNTSLIIETSLDGICTNKIINIIIHE